MDDIKQKLKVLNDAGATVVQEVKDAGGGRLTAVAKDPAGNIVGLIQTTK